MIKVFILLFIILFAIGLSYVFPVITRIDIHNNQHYSQEEIMQLANISIGTPFLWINRWRLQKLEQDPWIASFSLVKYWPDRVSLTILERQPFMTDGKEVFSNDGTLLPNAKSESQDLIVFSGWGQARSSELLNLITLLHHQHLEPKMVSYTPAGFTVQFANRRLFTPSLEALRTHWSSFISQSGTRVYVYPWGVSAIYE